jgi:hypothetical protein
MALPIESDKEGNGFVNGVTDYIYIGQTTHEMNPQKRERKLNVSTVRGSEGCMSSS